MASWDAEAKRDRDAARQHRQSAAVADVVNSRRTLRQARRNYHLALVIADDCGVAPDTLAERLDTKTLYVMNAIRQHRAGTCGCGAMS